MDPVTAAWDLRAYTDGMRPAMLPRRRLLQGSLAAAGLGLLSGCGLGSLPGQRPGTLRRIGYLDAGINDPSIEAAFRDGLRELGYVDGQAILIEYRSAEADLERLPALAAELVGLPVEIIVVSNDASAVAASRATSAIPIVAAGGNVVGRLVSNIARPEGNITGVSVGGPAGVGKRIELLKETVPTISRLAAVSDFSGTSASRDASERAAQAVNLPLALYDLRDLTHLSAVLATVRADGADGLVMLSGGVVGGGAEPTIGGEVLKSRLPAIAQLRTFAVNGGLLAHGVNGEALARRSDTYVDKILKGAKPGDLPIELPTTFDFAINLKTAQGLGITIPPSVLQQATEVIQ